MKTVRRVVQGAFLALVLVGVFAVGANCERWCPFGGVEAIYTYATEGNMTCSLGTSNFFILGGVLLSAVLCWKAETFYRREVTETEVWIMMAPERRPPREIARKLIHAAMRSELLLKARYALIVGAAMLAVAALIAGVTFIDMR